LCVALVTSNLNELTDCERSLIGRMLDDLRLRGFDLKESLQTLRRLRNRMMDPMDRQGEPTETTRPPITPFSWEQPDPVF
jgi:hypothetical protein